MSRTFTPVSRRFLSTALTIGVSPIMSYWVSVGVAGTRRMPTWLYPALVAVRTWLAGDTSSTVSAARLTGRGSFSSRYRMSSSLLAPTLAEVEPASMYTPPTAAIPFKKYLRLAFIDHSGLFCNTGLSIRPNADCIRPADRT